MIPNGMASCSELLQAQVGCNHVHPWVCREFGRFQPPQRVLVWACACMSKHRRGWQGRRWILCAPGGQASHPEPYSREAFSGCRLWWDARTHCLRVQWFIPRVSPQNLDPKHT